MDHVTATGALLFQAIHSLKPDWPSRVQHMARNSIYVALCHIRVTSSIFCAAERVASPIYWQTVQGAIWQPHIQWRLHLSRNTLKNRVPRLRRWRKTGPCELRKSFFYSWHLAQILTRILCKPRASFRYGRLGRGRRLDPFFQCRGRANRVGYVMVPNTSNIRIRFISNNKISISEPVVRIVCEQIVMLTLCVSPQHNIHSYVQHLMEADFDGYKCYICNICYKCYIICNKSQMV